MSKQHHTVHFATFAAAHHAVKNSNGWSSLADIKSLVYASKNASKERKRN